MVFLEHREYRLAIRIVGVKEREDRCISAIKGEAEIGYNSGWKI